MRERKKSELNLPPPASVDALRQRSRSHARHRRKHRLEENKYPRQWLSAAVLHHGTRQALEKVRHPQVGQGTQPRQGRSASLETKTPPKWRGFYYLSYFKFKKNLLQSLKLLTYFSWRSL